MIHLILEFCQQYNIKHGKFNIYYFDICQGKRKVDYVESISKHVKTIHSNQSALKQLMIDIDKTYNDDPAPLHTFYREWFNLVDITNKYWYKVWERHANQKWKSEFLFTIMKYFIINTCETIKNKDR